MAGALRLENVLKRAEELEAMHMEPAALDALYETVASKRTRAMPLDQLEPVFAKFLQLACQLRRGKIIKDGLHQYKKLAIAAAGDEGAAALERAVTALLVQSTASVTEAQAQAAQAQAAQQEQRQNNAEIDDLDEETPQDLMLALVTSEESKDRTDRELVTPWLKFLWENYRSVLDVLRNNSKLEAAYARVASEAFKFCASHGRKTEFRRLAELLRTHLQYAATQSRTYHADMAAARATAVEQLAQQQGISSARAAKEVTAAQIALHMPPNAPPYPIDLSDADTLQRFLDTRFEQLEQAVALELWQETYRSIEDVHTLLTATRRPIPVQSMATYYETLARVFAVSQNHLFHAATWFRYFAMLSSRRAPESELRRIASFCVLSLLCVEPTTNDGANGSTNSNGAPTGRTRRWMNLINLTRVPTREMLVEAALARNVLGYASVELRALFNLFQPSVFNPLTLKQSLAPLTPYLQEHRSEFAPYFTPMLDVAAISTFNALARVYTEVSLDFVLDLVAFPEPFSADRRQLERLLVRQAASGNAAGGYAVRIDHQTNVVRFVDSLSYPLAGTAGALVRTELYELARLLTRANLPDANSEQELAAHGAQGSGSRQLTVTEARAALIAEKREYQQRRERHQHREEEQREQKLRSEEEEHRERVRRADEQRAQAEAKAQAEEARIAQEQLQKELAAVELEEKRKLAITINSKGHAHIDLDNLANITRDQLQKMQIEQVEQETKSLDARMAVVTRRYDHLERALRQEEAKLWREEAERQHTRDREIYDKRVEALLTGARHAFDEGQRFAQRFSRVREEFHSFHDRLVSEHDREISQLREKNQKLLAEAKEARLEQIREELRVAEERRVAEEERRRAESARIEAERIERAVKEQERESRLEAARLKAEKIRAEALAARSAQSSGAPAGGASAGGAYRPPTGGAYRPPTGGAYRPPTGGAPTGGAYRPPMGGAPASGASTGGAYRPPTGGAYRPPMGMNRGAPPVNGIPGGSQPRSSPFGAAANSLSPANRAPGSGAPGAEGAPKSTPFTPSFRRNTPQ